VPVKERVCRRGYPQAVRQSQLALIEGCGVGQKITCTKGVDTRQESELQMMWGYLGLSR
jgi:hypothetical protein